MYHLRKIKVLLATCLLACTSLFAQDVKISLENAEATATSDQGGDEGASSAIDGDYSKFWHSQWSWGAVFEKVSSVDLTIALSEVTLVDYVRYIPRQGSNQGHWGEVEVFYSPNTTGTSFTSVGTFNLNMADIPHDFFLNGTEGVRCGQVKFTIRSGSNNHATAAEIEMYQLDRDKLNAFAQCFSDAVYTELKPGITSSSIADADVRALVQSMQSDPTSYKKFRVGEYEAYETLGTLQQRLKTKNQYSRYENPTGVYFTAGQSYLVAVSGIEDDAVGLKVKNWYLSESSSTYSLRNGLNYITATTEGNVFVNYYTDNYAEAPKVKVHFINAPVIGYWDQETMDNSDWAALLADKASDDHRIIITQSEHAQLAFPISAWKAYCPTDVKTLMGHYQNVQWALRDMMGLEKYGYQTRNRQIFYVVDGGFMAAGDEGAYCDYADLGGIMNANSFDFWGVAHEWGHNNQIDPGFHWSGCGETTNNIYASWAQYHFTANRDAEGNPTFLRLEDEVSGIDEYSDMRGGRMQTYFEEAVRKGVAWQLQDGPDYHNVTPGTITVTGRDADGKDIGEVTTTSRNYDHFVKLTPFWQLNLWGNLAGKCPDIITDVIHSIRTAENYAETYNTNGKQQINWMKLACDAAKINLLPFFEKAGMLRPIHAYIEDYGAGWNIIDEQMIANLKAYVKQKGYPAYTEEINYINAHNMHVYRDKLKLNVTTMQGERNGDKVIIQHSIAQNAVAFETYNAQDELIRITMYGLGSDDEHSFTQVLFPSDAAYIMAVGYEGERQMVYKVRTADELQTLISEAESLLSAVGSVNDPVAQKVELTADNYYCNALYTAEDNNDKFTSYKVLCDGNSATYLHTDYSGNAPSESHYVTIDLGSGNELTAFNLNYTTRYEGYACAPTQVTIEASNDNKTWMTLRSVTSGLNSANNAQNTIAGLGDGTPYRYIRMTVLKTSASTDYFVLSEMGLSELLYDVNLQPSYSLISTDVVVAAHLALQSAQEMVNNGTDYTTAYIALQKSVDALLAAREEMDKLNELKAPLITLIGSSTSLIAQCGTVVFNDATPDTELALQTSNKSEYYYLSTNANEPLEGSLDNLIDTSDDTYFHSAWSWDVAAVHNLKVDMGEGKSLKEFTFTYKTTKGLFPTVINVYGSNDDTQGELLHTFTKDNDGLPTEVGRSWTSSVISSEAAYRYIRFEVTESDGGGYGATPKGEYCFVMSYFGITEMAKPEGYIVTLGNEAGDVTRELMIATYEAVQEAQSVVDYANTEAQVNEAIEKLQAQYQALEEAKKAVRYQDYTVCVVGTRNNPNSDFGVEYQGGKYHDGDILNAPTTLTANQLEAINETASHQFVSIVVEDGVITVTYVPLYVVNVYGISDMGGVTFGGNLYGAGDEFPASSLDGLEAVVIDGYEVEMIVNEMYINVSYYKNYTITIEGVSNNESERVCVQYNSEEYVNGNVIRTLGEIDENYLSLVAPHYYAVERFMVDHDASIIIVEFINKSYLNILVGEITNMLTDCDDYNYDFAEVDNARTAKEAAEAVYNDYLVSASDYRDALNNLQSAKEALANAIQTESSNRQASREALRGQIEALRNVIAECGVVEFGRYPNGRTAVPLTEANLSTNAQEKSEGPIANLLKDDDSFFHSSWQGSAGAAHYLQVDLGEGKSLQEFVFGYTTRNNGPHPYIIVVSGSNDKDGSFEEIKVFNLASGLPNAGSTSWEASAPIVSSQPYRYLRFTVTKSSNLRSYGEYCFAMSKFELKTIAYSENEDYYVKSLNPNGRVTEDQLLSAYRTMIAAGDLDNDYTSKSDLDAKIDELQSLCDELSSALNDLQLPVVLTTDMESPVLYTIKSKRGDTKVLQYDPAEGHMFSIADASSDNAKQLFYFTVGDTRTQVYVHPFAAGEQVLAADNTENGAAKVFAREKGAASYDQWVFVGREQGYNLKPVGTSTYFSNFGGGTAKMGFYASSPDSDAGSLFSFASASIEGSAAYHSLKVYYDEVTKVKSAEIEGGSNPYYYPKQEADAYNEAYANTTDLLGTMTSAYVDYLEAYKALKAANEVLELNMPEEGKYYTIVSACEGDRGGQLMYATGENGMKFSGEKTAQSPDALWTFTEEGYMMNLQTGCAINVVCSWGEKFKLGEDDHKVVSIESLSLDGQVKLTPANGLPLHAQANGSVIVGWTSNANDASAWRIVEVEDMSLVNFALSMSQYEHAGLYLNYAVEIPDNVDAYYIAGDEIAINAEGVGTLKLTKIENGVIPARTGIILNAPAGDYAFSYVDSDATIEGNLLTGSTYLQYRAAEEGHSYYNFGQKDGVVGLYKNSVKYKYDDEQSAYVEAAEGATHYKVSANKVLFDWDASSQGVTSFRFRMGDDETGIKGITIDADATIYDLYGRRVLEVVTPGLYIINGEKRYIQVK